MNVFISIIEESYVASKTQERNHWIYSYLKVDPNYIEINANKNKNIKKIENMNKKLKNQDNKNLDIKEKNNKEDYDNELYSNNSLKVLKHIESINALKDVLNSNKEDFFSDAKENKVNRKDTNQVNDLICKFNTCEKFLNELIEIIPKIRSSQNKLIVEEFKKVVIENIEILENKLKIISNKITII